MVVCCDAAAVCCDVDADVDAAAAAPLDAANAVNSDVTSVSEQAWLCPGVEQPNGLRRRAVELLALVLATCRDNCCDLLQDSAHITNGK